MVAPSPASAFVGESTVINPATGDLTGPAKTIITNPTFLPEEIGEAGAAGGVSEASGAAAVAESSGLLPVLGSVLSFGVGTVIGSEICHVVGIEGCWYFGSEGADPSPVVETGAWVIYKPGSVVPNASGSPAAIPAQYGYSWFWDRKGSESDYQGYNQGCEGGLPVNPTGATANVFGYTGECRQKKGPPEVNISIGYNVPFRSQLSNRTFSYNATDDPAVTDYKPGGKDYAAPSEWSKEFAKAIKGHSADPAAHVGEKIASKIGGSEVANPYATTTVPNCTGLLWLPCKKELEELSLKPERSELGWETSYLTKPADAVVEVAGAGSKVVPGTKTKVVTNPNEEGMPLVVPLPEEGETYEHYIARLQPHQKPHRVNVCEACIDPEAGPNAVLRVHPEGGTRQDPATDHEVEVQTNPADAPDAGAGPGSCSTGSLPGVDLSPLNQPLGSRFPFGVFAFFVGWLGEWESSGDPEWTVEVIPKGTFGSDGVPLHLDFGFLAGFVEPARLAFLFVSFVGLLWFMGTAFLRLNGDNS